MEVARLWACGDLIDQQQEEQERAQIDEALAALGLVPERPVDVGASECWLWPDNVAAWNVFCSVSTQWRVGINGPTGLDYASVIAHMRHGLQVPEQEFDSLYAGVLAAESGALKGFAELRGRNGGKP
jgi:hypothetical protein